jgi:hypothetical protein
MIARGIEKDQIASAVRFRFEHGFQLTSGSEELLRHIRRHVQNEQHRANEFTRAGNMLAAAIPAFISADEALHFVSGTPEAVEVGKIAIIHCILEAERKSALAFSPSNGRLTGEPSGWIGEMFSITMGGLRRDQLGTIFENVTFVNFNYDRTIEQYLHWALQERANATAEEATDIISRLDMVRPYGSVGRFASQFNTPFSFGTSAYFDPFSRLDNLGTYTDLRPKHDAERMSKALLDASMIIILGFGYHPTNVDLIAVTTGKTTANVIGTVAGIHRSNHSYIEQKISQRLCLTKGTVELHDMKAAELLQQIRPRITMLLG